MTRSPDDPRTAPDHGGDSSDDRPGAADDANGGLDADTEAEIDRRQREADVANGEG